MSKQQANTRQLPNIKRQSDTTNAAPAGMRMEVGWGVIPVSTSAATYSELVTFNTPFAVPPVVVISFAGDNGSVSNSLGAAGNNIEGYVGSKVHSISSTGFNAYFFKPNGANWGANGYGYYTWIAVGV